MLNREKILEDVKDFIENHCLIDESGEQGFYYSAEKLAFIFRQKYKHYGAGERTLYKMIIDSNKCLYRKMLRVPSRKDRNKIVQKTCIVNIMYKDSLESFFEFKNRKKKPIKEKVKISKNNNHINKKYVKINKEIFDKIERQSEKENIKPVDLIHNILKSSL